MIYNCIFCDKIIDQDETGEPFLIFKDKTVCLSCYIQIIPHIYEMSNMGDGGMINLIFNKMIGSTTNKKKRRQITGYKKTFEEVKMRYNFRCCNCQTDKNLTLDHIIPVSKGGGDNIDNLQVLCRSCNSKKGNKIPKK